MNVVVHPEGTAELDERPADDVVSETLDGDRIVTINVTVDYGNTIVTRVRYNPDAVDLNPLATVVMHHLTGSHFLFAGPVVFTQLEHDPAHELLELARD